MYKNDELFYAFAQGQVVSNDLSAGNCASVALIKAAIEAFGLNNVFDHIQTPAGYEVTLKNGQKIQVTTAEYQKAKKASAFRSGKGKDAQQQAVLDEIREYAYLCFAVIIKHVDLYGEVFKKGYTVPAASWAEAVEMVNDGLYTPLCYYYLGLENHVRKLRELSSTKGRGAIVAWSGGHAVYVNDQRYDKGGAPAAMRPRFYGRFQIIS
jgi:cold shock CspA family protein